MTFYYFCLMKFVTNHILKPNNVHIGFATSLQHLKCLKYCVPYMEVNVSNAEAKVT